MRKTLMLILIFYFLALFQASFLVHFRIFQSIPNLILTGVVLLNLFENPKGYSGLLGAFIGGFFLDIFSENFLGFWILISLTLAVFIKFVLKKHVHLPVFKSI